MYCKICGNIVEEKDRFCSVCGADLRKQRKEEREKAVEPAPSNSKDNDTENKDINLKDEPDKNEEVEEVIETPLFDFKWNVDKSNKENVQTERIEFNWSGTADDPIVTKMKSAVDPDEIPDIDDINDDNNDFGDAFAFKKDIDDEVLFEFNKRNEEFQELLDSEFEKMKFSVDIPEGIVTPEDVRRQEDETNDKIEEVEQAKEPDKDSFADMEADSPSFESLLGVFENEPKAEMPIFDEPEEPKFDEPIFEPTEEPTVDDTTSQPDDTEEPDIQEEASQPEEPTFQEEAQPEEEASKADEEKELLGDGSDIDEPIAPIYDTSFGIAQDELKAEGDDEDDKEPDVIFAEGPTTDEPEDSVIELGGKTFEENLVLESDTKSSDTEPLGSESIDIESKEDILPIEMDELSDAVEAQDDEIKADADKNKEDNEIESLIGKISEKKDTADEEKTSEPDTQQEESKPEEADDSKILDDTNEPEDSKEEEEPKKSEESTKPEETKSEEAKPEEPEKPKSKGFFRGLRDAIMGKDKTTEPEASEKQEEPTPEEQKDQDESIPEEPKIDNLEPQEEPIPEDSKDQEESMPEAAKDQDEPEVQEKTKTEDEILLNEDYIINEDQPQDEPIASKEVETEEKETSEEPKSDETIVPDDLKKEESIFDMDFVSPIDIQVPEIEDEEKFDIDDIEVETPLEMAKESAEAFDMGPMIDPIDLGPEKPLDDKEKEEPHIEAVELESEPETIIDDSETTPEEAESELKEAESDETKSEEPEIKVTPAGMDMIDSSVASPFEEPEEVTTTEPEIVDEAPKEETESSVTVEKIKPTAPSIIDEPVVFPFELDAEDDIEETKKKDEPEDSKIDDKEDKDSKDDIRDDFIERREAAEVIAQKPEPPVRPAHEDVVEPVRPPVSNRRPAQYTAKSKPKRTFRLWLVFLIALLLIFGTLVASGFAILKFAPESDMGQFLENSLFASVYYGTGAGGSIGGKDVPPHEDTTSLINSQLYRNDNILEIEYDASAKQNPNENYIVPGAASAEPIDNNFWKTENSKQILFDEEAVGAVIDFNSKWTNFVNNGDAMVENSVIYGGPADMQLETDDFALAGKLTYNKLGIGDVRKSGSALYVWTHEEYTFVRNGKEEGYNLWKVYELIPENGVLKVNDYAEIS